MLAFFFSNTAFTIKKMQGAIYALMLFYIVSFVFPSSPVITNVLIGAILLAGIIQARSERGNKVVKQGKYLLGITALFLLLLLSIFYSENTKAALSVVSLRLPLLLLAIAFFLIKLEKKIWLKIVLFYVTIIVIMSVLGFLYGAYLTWKTKDSGYLYNDNICDLLFGKQAAYIAFYVSAAIFILTGLLLEKTQELEKNKGWFILIILWLIFYVFLLASKTALISLVVLISAQLILFLVKNKQWMGLGLLFFTAIVATVLLSKLFPKTLNRFNGITQTTFQFENTNKENHFNAEFDAQKWNSTNTRMAIWYCAKEIIEQQLWLGTGVGDREDELQKKYKEKNFIYAFETNKNTHNQYIEMTVSMGVAGFLLFVLALLVIPVIILVKQKNSWGICIILYLALGFVTENMLDRYQGEIIIAFIVPLVLKWKEFSATAAEDKK